jgi:dimethylhistidine N-methyltransferase
MEAEARKQLTVHRIEAEHRQVTFADDVRAGLSASPKALPPKYFYDALGSVLFDAITLLPEYYPTRAEREILRMNAANILGHVPKPLRMVELGSGSATKTRLLIEAAIARQGRLHYLPIDISETVLEQSSMELLAVYSSLRVSAYVSDYATALGALKRDGDEWSDDTHTLVLFLGSTIGNFNAGEERVLLKRIRGVLRVGDSFLLGADLKKSKNVLHRAYDDPTGVTAAFNLNLLGRINRELGGQFNVGTFAHRALYDKDEGRVEMHLVSRLRQTVSIDDLGMQVEFDEGETIHTENSYKFDLDQLTALADDTGFTLTKTWYDSAKRFSLNLMTAV